MRWFPLIPCPSTRVHRSCPLFPRPMTIVPLQVLVYFEKIIPLLVMVPIPALWGVVKLRFARCLED